MTVQDLYNILEKEIDAGNLTVDSKVFFTYDCGFASGEPKSYEVLGNKLFLVE